MLNSQKQKIAIFGGSFNPIHNGHIQTAQLIFKKLQLDKLFFVPSYVSPFKSKINAIKDLDRIQMIKNVLPSYLQLSLFEIQQKRISYTIHTVRYFAKKYPDSKLILVVGTDLIGSLHLWKDIDEIFKMVQIVAIKRKNYRRHINYKKFQVQLIDNNLIDGASQEIRFGNFRNINLINRQYIADRFLYLNSIVKNTLSYSRYTHCRATAKLASAYAQKHNCSVKQAYYAGLTHDITKEWSVSKHQNFLEKHHLSFQDIPNKVLHQHTGSLWLEKEYLSKDQVFLKAIRNHTTAAIEMSRLDKIVYVADKLAMGRKFIGIQKERQIALKNIDLAFSRALKRTKEHLEAQKIALTKKFKLVYQKWTQNLSTD